MLIPSYPDFIPLSLELKNEMHPHLALTPDGVSEFTFSGLYLFRNRYQYRVSLGPNRDFIISGITPAPHETKPGGSAAPEPGANFFMTPCCPPGREILESLFDTHAYWKNISESVLEGAREDLQQWGVEIIEDRDNFDYLYPRKNLADLSGKKFHKKKNLVNAFNNAYPDHEARPLTAALIPDALEVLERWEKDKGVEGDYAAAREALECFAGLKLRGSVYYVNGKPAGYCLGESIAMGKIFAIHFEKAIDAYKGIYQYINQDFAAALPPFFIHINREQDLGDEGLRQAKMTYRPSGFVRKYRGIKPN
ncbi:MAG: phosphatidylglycerol lysyltransferase domain-containing protein [Treponema sp.]|nr:phosphatidylglycerol lysyltransferase domain-containing protein [Treponema sp.]